jgi:hypothetical protein
LSEKCQFSVKYYDYEKDKEADFNCDEEEPLASGLYVFHDPNYLRGKINYEKYKQKVLGLKHKVDQSVSNNEPLFCIGFHLPKFSLSDLCTNKPYTCRLSSASTL